MGNPFVVAQIEKDHISEDNDDFKQDGREFHYAAMCDWWGWNDLHDDPGEQLGTNEKTTFKMYDDDDELYYEGWLLNDDQCVVQQFVLDWGKAYAGCTTILVKKSDEAGFVQEIG